MAVRTSAGGIQIASAQAIEMLMNAWTQSLPRLFLRMLNDVFSPNQAAPKKPISASAQQPPDDCHLFHRICLCLLNIRRGRKGRQLTKKYSNQGGAAGSHVGTAAPKIVVRTARDRMRAPSLPL